MGEERRAQYAREMVFETVRYPDIRFQLDSFVNVTRQADTLHGTAVGVLFLHGFAKTVSAVVKVYPDSEAGGIRVFARIREPSRAFATHFWPGCSYRGCIFSLGVRTDIWKSFFFGVDLILRPEEGSDPCGLGPSRARSSRQHSRRARRRAPRAGNNPRPAAANEVIISDYKFLPKTLSVAVGTTVTWVNHDMARHTVSRNLRGRAVRLPVFAGQPAGLHAHVQDRGDLHLHLHPPLRHAGHDRRAVGHAPSLSCRLVRGGSSVGRAPGLQPGGRGFESHPLHVVLHTKGNMPDISAGEAWILNSLDETAGEMGISGAHGKWPPPLEGLNTGRFHLTVTLGARQRRVAFLLKELEDVLKTPRIQSAIRYRLGGALQAIR